MQSKSVILVRFIKNFSVFFYTLITINNFEKQSNRRVHRKRVMPYPSSTTLAFHSPFLLFFFSILSFHSSFVRFLFVLVVVDDGHVLPPPDLFSIFCGFSVWIHVEEVPFPTHETKCFPISLVDYLPFNSSLIGVSVYVCAMRTF